jgi:hypothetical protein
MCSEGKALTLTDEKIPMLNPKNGAWGAIRRAFLCVPDVASVLCVKSEYEP